MDKMLWVKEQHPDKQFYMLFMNANNKIRKGSPTTYGDWATKKGFIWAASNTAGLAARRAARKEGGVGDGPGFYLLPVAGGKKVRNPYSAGFRGHHFLEAGVDYVNAEYPKQLYSILDTWFRTAKDSAGRRKPFVWSPRK